MKTYHQSFFIAILLVCGVQFSGFALDNMTESSSQLQFNFITPGARATALGGAFIGLADDATAVESNPAGLTILTKPEVSVEFKYWRKTTEHVNENIEGDFITKAFEDSVATVPFVSAVYPYKQAVFSLYRQELLNYNHSFHREETIDILLDASIDVDITNYGIGAAFQIVDGLSLAVSPRWSQINMNMREISTYEDTLDTSGVVIDDTDSEFSLNTGLLWNPHPKISIGAVYKTGPEFEVTQYRDVSGDLTPIRDQDLAGFTLHVPDSFGVGIALRMTDFWTFTLDAVHIRYTNLLTDFDVPPSHADAGLSEGNYTIDNATEMHFGMEYLLTIGKRFLAVRAGVYNDPAHNIRYIGSNKFFLQDYPGGEDQVHATGGLGFVLNDRFQIDTAFDIADKWKQVSCSAVYRFGRETTKEGGRKAATVHTSPPAHIQEERPSVTFTVVKFKNSLEVQSVFTNTPGVSNVNVTITRAGIADFIVTTALEKDGRIFITDIEIRLAPQAFKVNAIGDTGEVSVLSKKSTSLKVMVTF